MEQKPVKNINKSFPEIRSPSHKMQVTQSFQIAIKRINPQRELASINIILLLYLTYSENIN